MLQSENKTFRDLWANARCAAFACGYAPVPLMSEPIGGRAGDHRSFYSSELK